MRHVKRLFGDPGSNFFLFGPRGTGKSTLLKVLFPDALWVDLLDPPPLRELLMRPESLRPLSVRSCANLARLAQCEGRILLAWWRCRGAAEEGRKAGKGSRELPYESLGGRTFGAAVSLQENPGPSSSSCLPAFLSGTRNEQILFWFRLRRVREIVGGSSKTQTVVVDEVQRAPRVLDVVHQIIEGSHPRRFALTGSSSRKLKQAGGDLLGGRAKRLFLHPFMASELGPSFQLDRALESGLVPLIWDSPSPRAQLAAYADLYVREEIQQEGLVRDIGSFTSFLEAASFSHGSEVNVSHIARECQVGRTTVDSYFTVLEDLLLAFRLPVFTKRAKRATTSRTKFYFFDTGFFRSLRPLGPLEHPTEIGGIALEGLVAQHLRSWIDYGHPDCRLYFWRTRGGSEVDFILYGQDLFQAIEVRHAKTVR